MIYQKADIWSNFNSSNDTGKSNDVIVALGSLIKEDKDAVIEAFRQSGIPFPTDADNELISNAIVQVLRKNTKQSQELLKNLSVLIFASKENYSNFLKKKSNDGSTPKTGFLKDLFSKNQNPDGSKTSKVGDFLRQNKEQIVAIAGNLLSGIGNRNASTQLLNQSSQELQRELERQQEEERQRQEEQRRRAYSRRIMIGVVVVAALGAGVYFYMKSKKN
jgi:cobalamin biosynthesis Mg chelatase CobN